MHRIVSPGLLDRYSCFHFFCYILIKSAACLYSPSIGNHHQSEAVNHGRR